MEKRLYKSDDSIIFGVCGGIAEFLGLDPVMVRIGYVFLMLFSLSFPGLLLYIIMPHKRYILKN
jgi:phage shock protein C